MTDKRDNYVRAREDWKGACLIPVSSFHGSPRQVRRGSTQYERVHGWRRTEGTLG